MATSRGSNARAIAGSSSSSDTFRAGAGAAPARRLPRDGPIARFPVGVIAQRSRSRGQRGRDNGSWRVRPVGRRWPLGRSTWLLRVGDSARRGPYNRVNGRRCARSAHVRPPCAGPSRRYPEIGACEVRQIAAPPRHRCRWVRMRKSRHAAKPVGQLLAFLFGEPPRCRRIAACSPKT